MKKYFTNCVRQKSAVGILLSSVIVTGIYAQDKMLNTQVNATGIQWENKAAAGNFMLRVTGPDDYMYEKTFTGVAPSIFEFGSDGQYRYEITALPDISEETRENMRNARANNNVSLMKTLKAKSKKQSGHFQVVDGAILDSNIKEKGVQNEKDNYPLLTIALCSSLYADVVVVDDHIVQGSGCIGIDCVNGESFGFDTLRLKENNLRIGFIDTSASASFPSNDWQLTANDSSNGGANKFSIDDTTNGKTPFTVEANAPSNSLYVDDGGKVGLGTATPVVELHIPDGDTPTVRLEQDGSSGFTPQTWDVAGNETNFFVRDVTNGSKLPFKIRPNSPTDSLVIESTGVKVGETLDTSDAITTSFSGSSTLSAYKLLTLSMNNTNVTKKSDAALNMVNTRADFAWTFRTFESDEGFTISKDDTGAGATKEFKLTGLDAVGGMVLTLGSGATNTNGNWVNASSRALKENIEELNTEDALKAFHALKPVSYNYKADKTEQVLGFIAEDVPEIVAINSRNGISSMDMVALLSKVVQAKDAEMEIMKSEISELKAMQEKVAHMESILTSLTLDTPNVNEGKVSTNLK